MLVIAEIGINHDGDIDKALEMIEASHAAGADIVKFQYYDPLKLLGPDSPYLEYATQCQFEKEELEVLKLFCDEIGIEFLVSVFDIEDIAWADTLCQRHKIASRMNKDEDFLREMIRTGKPVIISTQSVNPFPITGVSYMHCVTDYPTGISQLLGIPYGPNLGISSHCPKIAPTIRAVNNGAKLIEHHVCFSRDEEGCDKSSSITFEELTQLCDYVADIEIKSN